jgi:hypothetical protein
MKRIKGGGDCLGRVVLITEGKRTLGNEVLRGFSHADVTGKRFFSGEGGKE